MPVRHVVERANIHAGGIIIDPRRARHGVIVAGRLTELGGEVDAMTHLNLDFPDHSLGGCVVVEEMMLGARICVGADGGFLVATPVATHLAHLGRVDVDARRLAWFEVLRERRVASSAADG